MTLAADRYVKALTVECPHCGEARTYPCVTEPYGVRASRPHQARLDVANLRAAVWGDAANGEGR